MGMGREEPGERDPTRLHRCVAWAPVASMRLSRRLARAELDPAITVTLEMDPERFRVIYLVVKNAGRGSARNVRPAADTNPSSSQAVHSAHLRSARV